MLDADKAALRRCIRAAFPGEEIRRRESEALCRHIMQWEPYLAAKVIGAYMPLSMEADVTPVILDVIRRGKTLVLPRVESRECMTMRRVRSMEDMTIGRWGIQEPVQEAEIVPPAEMDLLIVPLEGIDRRGARLGKGGGYYDRLLQDTLCVTLGAVMSWQWREYIPQETWDKPLQAAADHRGIFLFNQ